MKTDASLGWARDERREATKGSPLEHARLAQGPAAPESDWKLFGLSRPARLGRCTGRITAPMALPGGAFPSMTRAPGPTAGARTAWRASATVSAAPVVHACVLEQTRPDPEGADLRAQPTAPRIKPDGRPSLERSWRAGALAPSPIRRASRHVAVAPAAKEPIPTLLSFRVMGRCLAPSLALGTTDFGQN